MDLERYKVDNQPRPEYTLFLQTKPNATRATWNKTAKANEKRSAASLDHDVGVSLARQWAYQQPKSRRAGGITLERAADMSMDWRGWLAPGPFGVRLLLLTLLCWGSGLDQNADADRAAWNRLARDFGDVLNVLAARAGPYDDSITEPTAQVEGRKRAK